MQLFCTALGLTSICHNAFKGDSYTLPWFNTSSENGISIFKVKSSSPLWHEGKGKLDFKGEGNSKSWVCSNYNNCFDNIVFGHKAWIVWKKNLYLGTKTFHSRACSYWMENASADSAVWIHVAFMLLGKYSVNCSVSLKSRGWDGSCFAATREKTTWDRFISQLTNTTQNGPLESEYTYSCKHDWSMSSKSNEFVLPYRKEINAFSCYFWTIW